MSNGDIDEQHGDRMLSLPVSHQNPTADVARRIILAVTRNELRPGQRLPPERQLAADLGVGRSAVREALAALDLFGLLQTRQGSGTYLSATPPELLPQAIEWGLLLGQPRTLALIEARHVLEVALAGLAAAKAGEDDLDDLRSHMETMRRCDATDQRFVEADIRFHLEVARLAGNSVLSDFLSSIRGLLQVWITRAISADDGHSDNTVAEHEAILLGIEKHDPQAARAAMDAHVSRAGARLRRSLEQEEASQ